MPRFLFIVIAIGHLACGDIRPVEQAPVIAEVREVRVRPASLRLQSQESRQLVAQANGMDGRIVGGADIRYESLTPALIKVSPIGYISSLGPSGTAQVKVSSGSVVTTIGVTITAGVPTRMVKGSMSHLFGATGQTLAEPIAVIVTDEIGNPVHGAVVNFHLSVSGGTIEPERTVTDFDGVAAVRWTLGRRPGHQLITAQLDNVPDSILAITAEALPGPVALLEILTPMTAVEAGQSVELKVRAVDVNNHPIKGIRVDWNTNTGVLTVPDATTNTNGIAVASWVCTTATTAAEIHVTAAGDIPQESHWKIAVQPGKVAQLKLLAGSEQTARPKRISKPITIRAQDQYANPIASATVRFRVVAGEGTLGADSAITDEQGIVSVSTWKFGSALNQVVEATVAGIEEPLLVRVETRASKRDR